MNENLANPHLDETDLLKLALRLATYPGDPNTQNAQLIPGQLPDQLPVDIPLPEGSHILGSLILNPESINIYLDVHLSPMQVLTFYRQHMESEGWQTADLYQPHRGGFIASGARSRGGSETFYQGLSDSSLAVNILENSSNRDDDVHHHSGLSLTVNAFTGRDNITDLRLNLQMNAPFPPGPAHYRRGRPSGNIFASLPALEAPEGAHQIGGGGGRSHKSVYADAILETNNDLSMLAAYYKIQLEQAECVLTEEGQNGPLAWKTWTLKDNDEQWHGFFVIMKVLAQEYYLTIRMISDKRGKTTTES